MSPRGNGLSAGAVVDAAARLADAEGLEGLTLARVAAQVGVRTPSLYHHVRGLDDLRRLLALRLAGELHAALQAAAVGRSGDDALLALAHAYRRYAVEHPGRYAALQRAPDPEDRELGAAAAAIVEVVVAVLRGYGLQDDAALHAARVVRSALHGFVVLETGGGFGLPLDVDETFKRLLQVLAQGLRTL